MRICAPCRCAEHGCAARCAARHTARRATRRRLRALRTLLASPCNLFCTCALFQACLFFFGFLHKMVHVADAPASCHATPDHAAAHADVVTVAANPHMYLARHPSRGSAAQRAAVSGTSHVTHLHLLKAARHRILVRFKKCVQLCQLLELLLSLFRGLMRTSRARLGEHAPCVHGVFAKRRTQQRVVHLAAVRCTGRRGAHVKQGRLAYTSARRRRKRRLVVHGRLRRTG